MSARRATAALAATVALLAAAPAEAATIAVTGSKSCYRALDELTLTGTGFTPNAPVTITLDGESLGSLSADAAGNLSSPITIGSLDGIKLRAVVATDTVNPANAATTVFLGSALAVRVRPRNGAVGRKLRIRATGFTTGRRLYAHVVRKRYRRNVFVGKLRGPCRTGKARRRIVPASLPAGVYTVQFDTRRKYSRKTKVWVRFKVTVTPRARGAASLSRG